MKLNIYPAPAFRDNYIWIIHNTEQAVAIDPGDASPVLEYLESEQLQLNAILITHHHPDHTGGNRKLLDLFDVPVYGPKKETIPTVTHPVQEQDTIHLPDFSIMLDVIEIPGHTHGHIAYYGSFQEKNRLFCGDTLFSCGCGRIFEGTPQQMFLSLQKLTGLPDDTLVYCAHEYTLSNISFASTVEPDNDELQKQAHRVKQLRNKDKPTLPTTIAMEKACNPFLRCRQPTIIHNVRRHTKLKLEEPIEVFTALREWKNCF